MRCTLRHYRPDEVVIVEKPYRVKDLTGRVFARLTVIGFAGSPKQHAEFWCRCECGNIIKAYGGNLVKKNTRSCGCLVDEAITKHGNATSNGESPEYSSWRGMMQRCHNPNATGYERYGGRGIVVCDAWRHSFERFLRDVGARPSREHTLDRIDVNGNYEPGNVRWATSAEQMANKRTAVSIVTLDGVSRTVEEWSQATGIPSRTIHGRIARGWEPRAVLSANPRAEKFTSHRAMTFENNGTVATLAEWAKILGCSKATLKGRIRKGWPLDVALSVPAGELTPELRRQLAAARAEPN
jgi:hypothetical protein